MRSAGVLALALVLLSLALPSAAKEMKPVFFAGAGYGKSLEDNAPDGSIGVHGGAMFRVHPQFSVAGELGYQLLGKKTYSTYEYKLAVIPLIVQGCWMIPTEGNIQPMITGGIGLYNLRWDNEFKTNIPGYYNIPGYTGGSDSETDFGVHFGVGGIFGDPQASVRFGVDGKYHIIMSEGESTSVVQVAGRVYFGAP